MATLATTKDPGALYAAALGALHLSPEVTAVLSPIGAQLFAEVYDAAYKAGGAALNAIGSAALQGPVAEVASTVIEQASVVAGAVASAVGAALPMVNIFTSIVQILLNPAFAATGSNTDQQDCISFWAQQPGSSGPSDPKTGITHTTPADIFSGTDAGANHIPNSALGNCMAAILDVSVTEGGDDAGGDDAVAPAGSLHSLSALTYLTHVFKNLFPGPTSDGVGLPESHLRIFHSLRIAAGSNGPDHGTIPYAFLMDLVAGELDAGRLNTTYIAFLLNNYVERKDLGGGLSMHVLHQSVCGGAPAQGMATQIVALANAWKQTRQKIDLSAAGAQATTATSIKVLTSLRDPHLTAAQRRYWQQQADKLGLGDDGRLASLSAHPYAEWGLSFSVQANARLNALRRGVPRPGPKLSTAAMQQLAPISKKLFGG